jgi:hypothetical protein
VTFSSVTSKNLRQALEMRVAVRFALVLYISQAAIGAAVGFTVPWIAFYW